MHGPELIKHALYFAPNHGPVRGGKQPKGSLPHYQGGGDERGGTSSGAAVGGARASGDDPLDQQTILEPPEEERYAFSDSTSSMAGCIVAGQR